MTDINQLIEPITPNNTVNTINIYKEDYLPNVFINPNKTKGKQYENKYVITDPKIGQQKIKQFISSTLKSQWGLVSKAVYQKDTISLNTEIDKYMFMQNASKEDLKKIKYTDYFGLRVSDTDLYDFDRRMIYHNIQRDPDDNNVVIIDRNNAEPIIDLSKYKSIFIDKNEYKPIMRYYVKDFYDEDIPEFIGKQQDGITGSIIFPQTKSEKIANRSDKADNVSDRADNQENYIDDDEENKNSKSSAIQEELLYDVEKERSVLLKEQSKLEKDIRKTIFRYIDKYVNVFTASELVKVEDIHYIIDVFYEYCEDENININKRSIDAVNRRVDKLYQIENQLAEIPSIS